MTSPSLVPRRAAGPSVVTILLVEDDDGDATLVAEGFSEMADHVDLVRVRDGATALALLERGVDDVAGRPDLVLLDLNLPGLSGLEVLRRIKTDPRLADVPVTVLSTSDHPLDIERVYAFGGNAYVTKPLDLPSFLTTIARIHAFWVDTARLPGARS